MLSPVALYTVNSPNVKYHIESLCKFSPVVVLFVLLFDFCLFRALSIILPQVYSHGQQTIMIRGRCPGTGYQLTIAVAIGRRAASTALIGARSSNIACTPANYISPPLPPNHPSLTTRQQP